MHGAGDFGRTTVFQQNEPEIIKSRTDITITPKEVEYLLQKLMRDIADIEKASPFVIALYWKFYRLHKMYFPKQENINENPDLVDYKPPKTVEEILSMPQHLPDPR